MYSLSAPSYSLPKQGRCTETNVSDFDMKQRSALLPMFCLSFRINQLVTEDMQWVEDAVTGLGMTLNTKKINTFKLWHSCGPVQKLQHLSGEHQNIHQPTLAAYVWTYVYGLKFHAAFKTQTDQKLKSLLWLQLNWSQSSTHSDVLSDIRSLVSYLSWGFAWKFTRFACRRCACIQWNAHCMHRKISIMQLEAFILQKKAKKKVSEFTTCKPAWKITSSRRPSGTSHTCAHFS